MASLDIEDGRLDGSLSEKTGRIALSGGEWQLDPVRTAVTCPVIEALAEHCRNRGGVSIVLQTTGDLLTAPIVDDLIGRGMESRRLRRSPCAIRDAWGIAYGWSKDDFLSHPQTQTSSGRSYAKLCIGCDSFYEKVLGPVVERAAERRRTRGQARAMLSESD